MKAIYYDKNNNVILCKELTMNQIGTAIMIDADRFKLDKHDEGYWMLEVGRIEQAIPSQEPKEEPKEEPKQKAKPRRKYKR